MNLLRFHHNAMTSAAQRRAGVAGALAAFTVTLTMNLAPVYAQQPSAAPSALPSAAPAPAAVPPAAPTQPRTAAVPVPQADIAGVWIDHTGRGAVEIAPCGNGGRLCGHIFWLQSVVDERGRPLTDHKNPDTKKRGKPMCGTQILGELNRVGQTSSGGVWGSGWIYNPEDGENFDVEVKLLAPDRLSVMGYAGFKFLSETYTWKRASASVARCGPART